MLTFELTDHKLLQVHGDREGLLNLAAILTELAQGKTLDHVHLMSPEWGGTELSDEPLGPDSTLFKHVKVYIWPAEDKSVL